LTRQGENRAAPRPQRRRPDPYGSGVQRRGMGARRRGRVRRNGSSGLRLQQGVAPASIAVPRSGGTHHL